jgi:putative hemolysin
MTDSTSTLVFILILLILFSGMFSAVETAYSSASRIKLKAMENDDVEGADTVLKILDHYDRFLTTVLIGNNIVNIVAATLGTVIFTRQFGESKGSTISTIVITLTVLLFGEITPKSFAKRYPEHFAIRMRGFVQFFQVLFAPLNAVFRGWQYLTARMFKIEEEDTDISDELITMVDEAEKEGDLEQHESDLISAAIEFNDLDVRDVLTPRVELVAVPLTASLKEVANVFSLNSFSRLPVYEKNIDNIVGVIHEKDFYSMMYRDPQHGLLKRIIKPVIYTGENVKISTVLKQLQAAKAHLAVVLDEYGGTAGIITMEDIIEELVGEIWDEHDIVKEYYQKVDEHTYLVRCDADIDDMMERFGVEPEDEDEYDFITVSGWVIHELDHIPAAGESFDFQNLHVTVTQADRRKVHEIRVEIRNPEDKQKPAEKKEESGS